MFLFQSASKLLIMANYEINKEYISKNLCENKEKPTSTCNGKCHLAKELKKQDKKENSTPNSQKEKYELQLFYITKTILNAEASSQQSSLNITYLLFDYSNTLKSIFHPPKA